MGDMSTMPSVGNNAMRKVCGAKTRKGSPCQGIAMANGRCRMHGGNQPKGVASPQFVSGRYSKYLPTRLLDRYHEAESDTELLSLRSEIALVDSRLSDLLSKVDTGEAKKLWEQAKELNRDIQADMLNEDYGHLMMHCKSLDELIGEGLTDYTAWSELYYILDQRRRLAESERKRLIENEQTVRADKALTLAMALLQAVKENVTDRAVLSSVQTAFNRLLQAEVVA